MSFIGKALKYLVSPVGAALGLFGHKSKPALLPGPVTRDDVREQADRDRELRARRGAAADMLTGVRGAEAAGASIGRVVTGS